MPKRMVTPHIAELSGVDHPAHLQEGWLVMKSLAPNVAIALAQAEALAKGVDPSTATDPDKGTNHMPGINKADLPAEVVTYIDTLEKAVAGAAPAADLTEAEQFEKALATMPEPVRKHMLTQQREAAEAKAMAKALTDQALDAKYEVMAKALLHLPGVGEGFAKSLRTAAEASEAAFTPIFEVLKAADAAIAESGLFGEIGSGASGDVASAQGQLMAKADELQKADPALSHPEAVQKAAELNPDLVRRQRREALAANAVEA